MSLQSIKNFFQPVQVISDKFNPMFVGFENRPDDFIEDSEMLGQGCFASVWASVFEGYVVKEGHSLRREGWVYYALKAIESGSTCPILPRIEKVVVDLNNDSYSAVMERLEGSSLFKKPFIQTSMKNKDDILSGIESVFLECGQSSKVSDYVANFLKSVYKELKHDGPFRLDAHDENWMFRPCGEIVLTDPFSDIYCDWGKIEAKLLRMARTHPGQVIIK